MDVPFQTSQGARLGRPGGVAATGRAPHLLLQSGATAQEEQRRPGVGACGDAGEERQEEQHEEPGERVDEDRQAVVLRQAEHLARAVSTGVLGEPLLPEPGGGPVDDDHPGAEGEDRGEQAGGRGDEGPQDIEPGLLVAQRGEHAAEPRLVGIGPYVPRGGSVLTELGADPPQLQVREAAGDVGRGDQDRQTDEHEEQPGAQTDEDHDHDERGDHEGEREQ